MDISSDSTLLASGSADKNLKIWGLDFGDCHRSLFAHGDSLMAVAFQPNTHYVFTAGEFCDSRPYPFDFKPRLLCLVAIAFRSYHNACAMPEWCWQASR